MASIKGVQLKGLVQGIGHDRASFHASIFLNNKRIGSVMDDGWGGKLLIDIEEQEGVFDLLAEQYKAETKEELLSSRENIIYALLELNNFGKTL